MAISKEESGFKSNRQKCYQSRDVYFHCLDLSQECSQKCLLQYDDFLRDCPQSWVSHFIRQRQFDKYKREYFAAEAAPENLPKPGNKD